MIANIVSVNVKPENINDFRIVTTYNHAGTRREPGNVRFDVLQSKEDPTKFTLYEVFMTEADVAFHKTTEHYLKWRDTVAPYMAEPRSALSKEMICCDTPAQHKAPICFIAHRGYSGRYQQNTEEAFIKAVEHGSGGIETDVRVTKDGVLVVNHDSEAHYADGTDLKIEDHTFAELTAKPLRNKHTDTDLRLCTFKRYLEICRDGHMVCFIEFKGSFTDEMIDKAFNMAKEVYDLSMCELQSFNYDNLLRAHKAFPELKIMLTCDEHDADVDRCLVDGFDIDMQFHGLTDKTVAMFHERGLKVAVWTANTPEALAYCLSKNVDFIESDVFSSADGE